MRLLKFSASWCGPCKALTTTIDSIADKPALLASMESVDVDDNPEIAMQYGVRGVPTLIVVDDEGVVVKRATGALSKDKLIELATI